MIYRESFGRQPDRGVDLERLPSGKFETNELVLELAILSYNILRMIGQEALGKRNPHLKRAVKRRRHKVAAKCNRVLYIVDGSIVGEKEMGHFDGGDKELRDRERELNNWLMEQGW